MKDLVETLRVNSCRFAAESEDEAAKRRIRIDLEAASTIERLERERDAGWAFAKELSDALLKVRPLGGSELFVKRNEQYYADPAYCGAAIQENHARYHEATIQTVREQRRAERAEASLAEARKALELTQGAVHLLRKAIHANDPRNELDFRCHDIWTDIETALGDKQPEMGDPDQGLPTHADVRGILKQPTGQ